MRSGWKRVLAQACRELGANAVLPEAPKQCRTQLHVAVNAARVNIAHQTKSHFECEAKPERFTNHPAANQLINHDCRGPYKLPEV